MRIINRRYRLLFLDQTLGYANLGEMKILHNILLKFHQREVSGQHDVPTGLHSGKDQSAALNRRLFGSRVDFNSVAKIKLLILARIKERSP